MCGGLVKGKERKERFDSCACPSPTYLMARRADDGELATGGRGQIINLLLPKSI